MKTVRHFRIHPEQIDALRAERARRLVAVRKSVTGIEQGNMEIAPP